MQTEVKFICGSPEEAAAVLARFTAPADARGVSAAEAAKPPSRKKGKEPEAPPAVVADPLAALTGAGAPTALSDPLAALGIPTSAGQLPPVAMAAPVVQTAPTGPGQQDVIKAFVALGQKPGKGIDAVKVALTPFQVQTVTAIKPEHFAYAVKAAVAALEAPTLADVAAAVKAALGQ